MKKYCNYCNQSLDFNNHHQWMAHRSNCINNPNRAEKFKSISDAQKRRNGTKIYNFNCIKCGKKYKLEVSKHSYEKGNYRKHCSRVCANSHVQTPEQNQRRRSKLKGRMVGINRHRKIKPILMTTCELCKKEFYTKCKKQRYCSRGCARVVNSRKGLAKLASMNIDISAIVKEQYRNGKQVYGGTTLWYEYEDIKVQGTYELLACYILDLHKELGIIKDWEYTNDRFQYLGIDGEHHMYLLDFKVFNNGSSYYVEIKGFKRPNDELKWESVKNKGYQLEIWNFNKIKKNGMGMVVPDW